MDELEARVAALEVSHADYRAVLSAVNALGANQRDHSVGLARANSELAAVKTDVAAVKTNVAAVKTDLAALKIEFIDFRQETRSNFRSVDEQFAQVKDLIISLRDG